MLDARFVAKEHAPTEVVLFDRVEEGVLPKHEVPRGPVQEPVREGDGSLNASGRVRGPSQGSRGRVQAGERATLIADVDVRPVVGGRVEPEPGEVAV